MTGLDFEEVIIRVDHVHIGLFQAAFKMKYASYQALFFFKHLLIIALSRAHKINSNSFIADKLI